MHFRLSSDHFSFSGFQMTGLRQLSYCRCYLDYSDNFSHFIKRLSRCADQIRGLRGIGAFELKDSPPPPLLYAIDSDL